MTDVKVRFLHTFIQNKEAMSLIKCALLVFCYHQLICGAVSEFTPTVYTSSSRQCGQYDPMQDEKLLESLQQIKKQLQPHVSCKSIYNADPSSSSGYYNITIANGSVVQVYCDMEGTNCGGEGGWTRVAYINMTQAGATCPMGLNQRSFNDSKSYCGNTGPSGCIGTMFPTLVEYSRVCGRIRGYQYGATVSFYSYNVNTHLTIDDNYVDGVSITYGSAPRKHIWTYAAGPRDTIMYSGTYDCPCKQNSTTITPPFVGTDYYCESGVELCCPIDIPSNDTLWDGQQCGGGEAPCCTHSNMPWFIKTLNETTTEDIELRLCKNFAHYTIYNTDVPLDLIEIFVQ